MVPLRPRLNQFALAVDDEDAVLKTRRASRCRRPKRTITSCVTFRRFLGDWQFAALKYVDPVWGLGEDAALRSPCPSRMSERLRPADYNLVGTSFVFASLFLGKGETPQGTSEQNKNAHGIANALTVTH